MQPIRRWVEQSALSSAAKEELLGLIRRKERKN
jgi:hypothetical protein